MNALLKNLHRAANDWRKPERPPVLSIIAVGSRRSLVPVALLALVASVIVAAASSAWFMKELTAGNSSVIPPILSNVTPVLTPKTDAVSAIVEPAPAAKPAADAPDIVLPASQLDLAVDDTDPAINIVASKLGDLPVMRAPGAHTAITISPAETSASAEDLADRATAAMQNGDSDYAFSLFEQALALDPASHSALAGESFLLAHSSDYDGAARLGRKLVKLYPRDLAGRKMLVTVLSQSAAPEAEEELTAMAEAMPNDAALQAALAHKLINHGDIEDALPHLDRAVRAAPHELAYRLELAGAYDHLNLPAQAVGLYREVLRAAADPDNASRHRIDIAGVQRRVSYLEYQASVAPQPR